MILLVDCSLRGSSSTKGVNFVLESGTTGYNLQVPQDTIRELIDWTVSLLEDEIIAIKISCGFKNNNGGYDLE